jgi:hypothetical protein
MIDFCNAVNGGLMEPRDRLHGLFLLRLGDELKQTGGSPGVPDEFKSYLLSNPIDAQLIEVKERRGKKTTVRLNRGKNHGLLPGMELHVLNPEVVLASVKVSACEDEACDADMTRVLRNGPAPRVGWKLSTRWRLATVKPITTP